MPSIHEACKNSEEMLRKKGRLKQKRKAVGSAYLKMMSSLTLGSDKTETFYVTLHGDKECLSLLCL